MKNLNKPKVSVIIPIYKASEYLNQCINSVVKQSLNEIEIILVNDCSPDKKDDQICKDFAREDKRIRYIKHKENKGPGGARNTGVKHAIGEYIWFIDSDDYISSESINILYNTAREKKLDILVFSAVSIIKSGKSFIYSDSAYTYNKIMYDTLFEGDVFLKRSMQSHSFNVSSCLQLIKTKHIKNLMMTYKYPEKQTLREDTIFVPILISKAKKVYCISYTPYVRRRCKKTSTNLKITNSEINSYFKVFKYFKYFIENEELDGLNAMPMFFRSLLYWLLSLDDFKQAINNNSKLKSELYEYDLFLINLFKNISLNKRNIKKYLRGVITIKLINSVKRIWYLFNKIPIMTIVESKLIKRYKILNFEKVIIKEIL